MWCIVVKSDRLVIWGTGFASPLLHMQLLGDLGLVTLLRNLSAPLTSQSVCCGRRKGKENVSHFETPSGSEKRDIKYKLFFFFFF